LSNTNPSKNRGRTHVLRSLQMYLYTNNTARFYINLTFQQHSVICICIQFVSHFHRLQHASCILIPPCTPSGSHIRTRCITCSNGHLGLISIFCGLFQEFIDWWCKLIDKTFAHSLFHFTITVFVSRFPQRRYVPYNRQEQRKGQSIWE
jgi:hypothetical protein